MGARAGGGGGEVGGRGVTMRAGWLFLVRFIISQQKLSTRSWISRKILFFI